MAQTLSSWEDISLDHFLLKQDPKINNHKIIIKKHKKRPSIYCSCCRRRRENMIPWQCKECQQKYTVCSTCYSKRTIALDSCLIIDDGNEVKHNCNYPKDIIDVRYRGNDPILDAPDYDDDEEDD